MLAQAEMDRALVQFEGLVHETARQIVEGGVELEIDDVQQLLRIKVWYALGKFSAPRAAASKHLSHERDARGRSPLERFVYGCVANFRKDIEKRPRRFNLSIDEIRDRRLGDRGDETTHSNLRDWFDERYLSVDAERVFSSVEEPEEVTLPSTLTDLERRLVRLRLDGRMLMEIDRELGLSRGQREKTMQSVREKLGDWKPTSAAQPRSAPTRPLPSVEPQPARPRDALAA